ncbi:MAG: hypothetical protein ACPG4T_08555 [Nannocystaceae bacterium]
MMRDPLKCVVRWSKTSDPDHPLEAWVEGVHWQLRLGDFPAEPLWTLMINGSRHVELSDWPSAWTQPS